ncbi:E3 ubiquitin-protein ligase TRAF7-like isoform X1 [Biomphalaria glabrata]|uniref:E3 ubiquitin-protein ligase TRAF7-like isoform X1 n=1 Tax=Biomphalaria glabrata TaxID=6526 RepID=A0A2C9L330_BIOGL|nr:E3 ubiquitin-protein ligase TRAF7-like isoform X1 [Biomphalaria glabrata]XP_055891166.1 E3 ubiquitin-protein ligase TRAF7-like isoform X1 [Biomphalaria glabrata]
MMSSDTKDILPTKFVVPPSSHLRCPICGGLYHDPVINIKCGHTFCKNCAFITTYCPLDKSHCDTSQLVVNRLVVGQIEDLQIYCCHGLKKKEDGDFELVPGSCAEILNYCKRVEHESACPYALVPCPNSKLCSHVPRKDLESHLSNCVNLSCPYFKQGCTFQSNKVNMVDHSKQCAFKESGKPNNHLAQKIQELELMVLNVQSENAMLASKVVALEEEKNHMASQLEKNWNFIQTLHKKLETLSLKIDQLKEPSTPKRPTSGVLDGVSSPLISSINPLTSTRASNSGKYLEKWEMPFQFKCIGTLRGHKDVVWALTTRKGKLYSGGADGIIKIWSLEQLAVGCITNINAHRGIICTLTSWANTVISAGADMSIKFWDVDTYELKSVIENAQDNTICSLLICEGFLFSSSFSDIKVWDLKTLAHKVTIEGAKHWVRALALSENKDKLYSGSHNAINVWETSENFQQLATIEREFGSVYSLVVSKDYIIAGTSGTYNQNIHIFNIDTHEFVLNLCGHLGTVTTLVISPSGRFLFSASHDSNIQMWGLEKLLPIQTLSRHQGSVNALTLHGDFLLSGSEDHEIKVFRYFPLQ